MQIYNNPQGRLGNSIFRYFASIVFGSRYDVNFEIVDIPPINPIVINDEYFVEWLFLSNNPPRIDSTNNYIFIGYFQHDYSSFKEIIQNYIITHPNDKLWTDGNTPYCNNFNYPATYYLSQQLLKHSTYTPQYDIVVHLRLEDSIEGNRTMDPNSIKQIIEKLDPTSKICFVVNQPTKELEYQYIDSLKQSYGNTIIESNDPITDFHIMKNAKILIASLSTLSWVAGQMNNSLTKFYFPNIKTHRNLICESIQTPIPNTIVYDYDILHILF
jgi:hypothetical protein